MKLYTEIQVRKAIELARDTHQEGKPYLERYEYDYTVDDVIKQLTPIQLPSDEEIENESPYVPKDSHIICFAHQDGFIDGAIWLREKIKGGEND